MTYKLPAEKLWTAAGNGVGYLLTSIRDDGSFVYHRDAVNGAIPRGYNILRHAGSLCILYQAMPLVEMQSFEPRMEKACAYMMTYLKHFPDEKEDFACIVEANAAKLGGTGLALLALTERHKIRPDIDSLSKMRQMAAFLLWMQEDSGRFRSKLDYGGGKFSTFESIYYPGEAILALLRLFSVDQDTRWLRTAEAGADYLLKNPIKSQVFDRGHHHWFAIALAELYMIVPKRKYYKEFWRIVDSTVLSVRHNLWGIRDPDFATKFFSSSGMATRGETLVAGLCLELKLGKTKRIKDLLSILHELLEYCLSLQINSDEFDSSLRGGVRMSPSSNLIRIDNVQHVLSVVMGVLHAETMVARANQLR